MITRAPDPASPRLRVLFNGKEYYQSTGPKSWEISSTLTNLFDGWTMEFDNADGRNDDLIDSVNPHRWKPIIIQHADPMVDGGQPRPRVMGVATRCEYSTSDQASSLRLSGYDLGKLFDSCMPLDSDGRSAWYRIRGHTWEQLMQRCIDSSWVLQPLGDQTWGIQGIRSGYLNRKVCVGRYGELQDYGQKYAEFMPPIQTEPGEAVYDTLSRFARLTGYKGSTTGTGSFFRVSADGYVEIFNPDDVKDDAPLYTFDYHLDEQNKRIKSSQKVLDGEQLYTDYMLYTSVLRIPYKKDSRDPNAGKFTRTSSMPGYLGVNRVQTFTDAEAYTPDYAAARVDMKRRNALYSELTLTYEVQGHSWPASGVLSGRWVPLVEGYVADVRDTRNKVRDRLLVESVTWRQNDAPQGSTSRIVLRKLGLLGS